MVTAREKLLLRLSRQQRNDSGDSLILTKNRSGAVMPSEKSAICVLICEKEVTKPLCWRNFLNFSSIILSLESQ